MSALAQPTLEGIPPAPVQTSAMPATPVPATDEPLKCALLGHLAGPARVLQVGDDAVLEVLVHQHVARHPQALPVLAAWHWPSTGLDPVQALHRAQALAARLPAGAEVSVLGRGLEAGHHHHGQPVLRLMHVLGIAPTEGA